MKKYEEIIKLNSELLKLMDKINELKPEAIKELYKMGYSMDRISTILYVGKINVLKVLHNKKLKINRRGGKRKNE